MKKGILTALLFSAFSLSLQANSTEKNNNNILSSADFSSVLFKKDKLIEVVFVSIKLDFNENI